MRTRNPFCTHWEYSQHWEMHPAAREVKKNKNRNCALPMQGSKCRIARWEPAEMHLGIGSEDNENSLWGNVALITLKPVSSCYFIFRLYVLAATWKHIIVIYFIITPCFVSFMLYVSLLEQIVIIMYIYCFMCNNKYSFL